MSAIASEKGRNWLINGTYLLGTWRSIFLDRIRVDIQKDHKRVPKWVRNWDLKLHIELKRKMVSPRYITRKAIDKAAGRLKWKTVRTRMVQWITRPDKGIPLWFPLDSKRLLHGKHKLVTAPQIKITDALPIIHMDKADTRFTSIRDRQWKRERRDRPRQYWDGACQNGGCVCRLWCAHKYMA